MRIGLSREGSEMRSGRQLPPGLSVSSGQPVPKKLLIVSGLMMSAFIFSTITLQSLHASQSREAPVRETIVVEKPAPVEMVEVLVPKATIDAGRQLEPRMFMSVRRPKLGVSEGTITSFDQVRGQFAKAAIPANQALHRDYVTAVRPPNQVAASIPFGHRAVTINVSATSGVEGWAQAGAHVDVMWVSSVLGEKAANTIVRNVRVLSAERKLEAPSKISSTADIPTTVTLLASDKDAQKISLASSSGSLILLLRGSEEQNGERSNGGGPITLRDLRVRHTSDSPLRGYVRSSGKEGGDEWVVLDNGRLLRRSP